MGENEEGKQREWSGEWGQVDNFRSSESKDNITPEVVALRSERRGFKLWHHSLLTDMS